jgi:hypothetical protein
LLQTKQLELTHAERIEQVIQQQLAACRCQQLFTYERVAEGVYKVRNIVNTYSRHQKLSDIYGNFSYA